MSKGMLEAAIKLFGTNHKITISISQKLDEKIVEEQSKLYKKFKGEI